MRVRVLGAHSQETKETRQASLLVDGVLALDAGGLTSSLSLEEQTRLGAILLTHRHYDHVRDVPFLGLNTVDCGVTLPVFGLADTLENLHSRLMDGIIYPDLTRRPSPEAPRLRLVPVEPFKELQVLSYSVLAVPMAHSVPAIGYLVAAPDGASLFFTGDTGAGFSSAWERISPRLIVTEASLPDRLVERARTMGHLTPSLLRAELEPLQLRTGGLPPIVALHINPAYEGEVRVGLAQVASALGASIVAAHEGMTLDV
jgi:ribonuclease BN (tRNA processing enzyme)